MINLYRVLSYLAIPFLKLYFYIRCCYGKDRWKDVGNHFGIPTKKRPNGSLIWIHAASIGESMTALTYITHLKKDNPDLNILLTTITVTSADIMREKLRNLKGCLHQFVVADSPFWVKKFINYWKPEQVFFLESEIWPNIIDELYRCKIPIFLLNARLSLRSFKKWKHFHSYFSKILMKFTKILAQSDIDMKRYSLFSPENTCQIDNLKYANALLPCNNRLFSQIKDIINGRHVLVAASTHPGEEEVIINAHIELKKYFEIVTIIIPRHINRINEVTSLLKKYNLNYILRSRIDSNFYSVDVVCVDTFGELGTCYRLADVTFVGGSLVPIGGHNIYEPVSLGKVVLFGPFMDNTAEVKDFLLENKVAFEVKNSDDIVEYCKRFFSSNVDLLNIKCKAQRLTKNNSLQQIDMIVKTSLLNNKY